MVVVDEDYILDAKVQKTEESKKANIVLSLIIFNCIADSKLNERFEFQDVVDAILRDALVKSQGAIYKTYCTSYKIKFQNNPTLLDEITVLE
jgi:hypothetical protein